MTSPQTENGFTRIANEILEAIQMYKFSLNEMKIIMCVWRFTYGFNRKSHAMSLSFFENHTGLSRTRINTSLKNLQEANVIKRTESGGAKRTNSYQFNKHYTTWKTEKYAAFNSVQTVTDTSVQIDTRGSVQNDTDTSVQGVTIDSVQDDTVTSVQTVTDTSVQNDTQERKVKEIVKKDIKTVERNEVVKEKTTPTTTPIFPDREFGEVVQIFEANLCMLSPIQQQSLGFWFDDFNQNKEVFIEAIKIAADRNRKNYGFVEYLLKEWSNNKLTTVEQIRSHERNGLEKRRRTNQGGYSRQAKEGLVPEWFEERKEPVNQKQNNEPEKDLDIEERRRALRESLSRTSKIKPS